MSIHRFLGTIQCYDLVQVAAFVTALATMEDAPEVEGIYHKDRDIWVLTLYAV